MSTSTAGPHGSAYGTPRLAKLAYLAHNEFMNTNLTELSVSQARDHFCDAVNRPVFGGEITDVTRGRNQQRAAAIVPAEFVQQYKAMIDKPEARRIVKSVDVLGVDQVTPGNCCLLRIMLHSGGDQVLSAQGIARTVRDGQDGGGAGESCAEIAYATSCT